MINSQNNVNVNSQRYAIKHLKINDRNIRVGLGDDCVSDTVEAEHSNAIFSEMKISQRATYERKHAITEMRCTRAHPI